MSGKAKQPGRAVKLLPKAGESVQQNKGNSATPIENLSPEESRLMLHELHVHQVELEMQNEELRRVQVELHTVRTRYVDLYDMAPVSYCTLNKQGLIVQANFATAAMLGVARGALVKQPLSRFILKEDQDTYYLHRKQLLDSGEPQLCELRMVKDDGTSFWVHLATTVAHDHESNSVQRIVMMPCPRARPSEDQA